MKSQKPKQYIQGWTEFYRLKYLLTQDVLIPRPETELLVEEALNSIKGIKPEDITVIDIGTGSGNIAISVAKNAPEGVKIFGVDISNLALKVAEQNAILNGVNNKVIFFHSDLLGFIGPSSPVIRNTNPLILVANLPYIPTGRLMFIDPMVTEWEPKIALDGGKDGFDLYRKLFTQMNENKFYPKLLIAEIDEVHGETAKLEAKNYFPNAKSIEIKQDLTKRDRILKIIF